MGEFALKIVTPDSVRFEGMAQRIVVRTTAGNAAILPGHINYVAPLGMGAAVVKTDGKERHAACIGGMISVVDGTVTLVAASFEWSEDIDTDRARSAIQRAKKELENPDISTTDQKLAKARIKRAEIRLDVAKRSIK